MDINIDAFKKLLREKGVDTKALSEIKPKEIESVNVWADDDGYNPEIKDVETFVENTQKEENGYTDNELRLVHQAMSYLDGTEEVSDIDIAAFASFGGDENHIDSKDVEKFLELFDEKCCDHPELSEDEYFALKNPTDKNGEAKIKERDDGSKYITVEKPSVKNPQQADSLVKIIAQCYDLEAMGIDPESQAYLEMTEIVMDANPQIYGTKDFTGKISGGRAEDFEGNRADIALVPGEEFNIPEADAFCKCGCFGDKTKLPNAYIENSKLNYDEEDGSVYVVVEAEGGDNSSLEAIINKNYDLVGLAIEKGTPEYEAMKKEIMDANPEIYGTIDENGKLTGGRVLYFASREEARLNEGDIFILPDIDPECICKGEETVNNANDEPKSTKSPQESVTPSMEPSQNPTPTPSASPTPSTEPSQNPTPTPSAKPTPSTEPSQSPTLTPSTKPTPSTEPSQNPTPTPSTKPTPSTEPSQNPTPTPSATPSPTPSQDVTPPSLPPIEGGTEVDVDEPDTPPSTSKPTPEPTCAPGKTDTPVEENPPEINDTPKETPAPTPNQTEAPVSPPSDNSSGGCDSPEKKDEYVEEEEPDL